MRVACAIVSVCLFLASTGNGSAQTFPRPFETGYFPGLQSRAVVATNAGVEIIADPNPLTFQPPLECCIARTVMVHNTSTTKVLVGFAASLPSFPEYTADAFINHPQGPSVFLDPGESHPIRLHYELSQRLSEGTLFSSQLTVRFSVRHEGSQTTDQFDVVLPADMVEVVGAPNGSYTGPPPNATIAGVVADRIAETPCANCSVTLTNSHGLIRTTTNSNGAFSIPIGAYQRTGMIDSLWSEYLVMAQGTDGKTGSVVVAPRAGQATTANVTLSSSPAAEYAIVNTLDLDLNTEAWAASADGSLFATVPFHSALPYSQLAPLAYLTVFNGNGELLWRYPITGETPTVDVSADGSLIATTRHGALGDSGGTAIVLDRTGRVVMMFEPRGVPQGFVTSAAPYMAVKLSRSKQYLAVGDQAGALHLVEVPSGRVVWSTFTNGQVRYLHFDTDDQRLFVSSGDGYLRAFDLQGNLVWKTYVDAWLTDMDVSAHYILATSKAGRGAVHLINKGTGATLWSYPVEARGSGVLIAPDESYVWFGTEIHGGPIMSTVFSIDGTPVFDTYSNSDARGGAMSGAVTGDSNHLAVLDQFGVSIFDRNGYRVARLAVLDNNPQIGMNKLLWIAPDASRIVAAFGKAGSRTQSQVYVFQRAPAASGVCGTASGSTLATAPTTNLCSLGTASTVSGSGPWAWTCAGSNGGATASCSAALNSSDCLFNWAQRAYPTWFSPASASSVAVAPYYYRYYPQTQTYLGTSSANNHVYYYGPLSGNALLDVGALTGWLTTAGCQ